MFLIPVFIGYSLFFGFNTNLKVYHKYGEKSKAAC
jgi:hypothetical protein